MPNHIEDIRQEPLICKKWNFGITTQRTFPDGILVTGANSFIGSHIVKVLQEIYPGPVHLLLRAPSMLEGILKMQRAFTDWELGNFAPERFNFHLGDITEKMMGLPEPGFEQLKSQVGKVIHLAMTPLYHLPYHHFKKIWIPELERMIAFCGDPVSPKTLHYASSFNANFFLTEEDFKALNTNAWQSGYAGFKWVANQAIQSAAGQGLQACIYDIPLVLGSEKNGICPPHYSIWLILEIFLKTGYYFPFRFRIIPVDILAEIMVFNALKDGKADPFTRPMLNEAVTEMLFAKMAASLLGLKPADLATVREACQNKLRFDFMMPSNFYELLEKVNSLPAIFPEGFSTENLPSTMRVFISNLNRIIALKQGFNL